MMDASLTRQLCRLVDQISTIVVGKRAQIEDCMACLLAGGQGAAAGAGRAHPVLADRHGRCGYDAGRHDRTRRAGPTVKTSAASGEPADPGRRACLGLLAAPVFTAVRAADEAAWPNRPLRFVVAFAAGGTMDSLARWLAPRLAERLGVQVLVDNRPGAGGNISGARKL